MLKIRTECLKMFKTSYVLIKESLKGELSLNEIAKIIYRTDPDKKSFLEEIIDKSDNIYQILKNNLAENDIDKDLKLIKFESKKNIKKKKLKKFYSAEEVQHLPAELYLKTPFIDQKLFKRTSLEQQKKVCSQNMVPLLKKTVSLMNLNPINRIKRRSKNLMHIYNNPKYFYFVRSFIEQLLEIITKSKKKEELRGRFFSEIID